MEDNNNNNDNNNNDEEKKGGGMAKGILVGLGAAIGITAIGIGGKLLYDKFNKKPEPEEKKEKQYINNTEQVIVKLRKQKNFKPKIIQDEFDHNYIKPNSIRNGDDEEIIILKNSFICPISQMMMEDPVITPYGTTYEKIAILNWIFLHKNDYLTQKPLTEDMLVPNYILKSAIKEYKESYKM